MAHFPIRQYKPGGEFVAVRAFEFRGREFAAGEPFPWRELELHETEVQMLWRSVLIDVDYTPAPSAPAPTPVAAAPAPRRTERRAAR